MDGDIGSLMETKEEYDKKKKYLLSKGFRFGGDGFNAYKSFILEERSLDNRDVHKMSYKEIVSYVGEVLNQN